MDIIRSKNIYTTPNEQFTNTACKELSKDNWNCGNTTQLGEFTRVPESLVFNNNINETLYLKYYQSIIGINQPFVKQILVEPIGENCSQIKTGPAGLDNFWRSIINVNCPLANLSISQASPIRNCLFGSLTLCAGCCAYCGGIDSCDYTSGGFMANSIIQNDMSFGSQQQFLAKDCHFKGNVIGGAWNITLLNCKIDKAIGYTSGRYTQVNDQDFQRYTYPDITMSIQDGNVVISQIVVNKKLFTSDSIYIQDYPFKPDSQDIDDKNWIDITDLLDDTISTYNQYNVIILVNGLYKITRNIECNKHIIGLGLPIIQLEKEIKFKQNCISSLIFDTYGQFTGTNLITYLYEVVSFDICIRHGGFNNIKNIKISLNNSCALNVGNDCYIEHLWCWKADHGADGNSFTNQENSPADYGVIVDGVNVHICGLHVEHFDRENLIWNGDNGKLIFFQNEIPYYNKSFGDPVVRIYGKNFVGYSMGIYCFLHGGYDVKTAIYITEHASETIKLTNVFTKYLKGDGNIESIIYDEGLDKYFGSSTDSDLTKPKFIDNYIGTPHAKPPKKPDITPDKPPKKPDITPIMPKKTHRNIVQWIVLGILFIIFIILCIIYFGKKK